MALKEPQRLPMKYFELKYGTYMLKAYGEGLESERKKVNIARQKTTTLDINLKKKQKSKAIRYSLMFPGGGQFYEGSSQAYVALFIQQHFLVLEHYCQMDYQTIQMKKIF